MARLSTLQIARRDDRRARGSDSILRQPILRDGSARRRHPGIGVDGKRTYRIQCFLGSCRKCGDRSEPRWEGKATGHSKTLEQAMVDGSYLVW